MKLKDRIDVVRRGTVGEGVMPHQLSFVLHFPFRSRIQFSPAELAERLNLKSSSRVLEVGPGSGFFSVEIARRIPDGSLDLLDLQEGMLAKARRKLEAAGISNTNFLEGDITRMDLPQDEFDVAFLVTVLGEVGDREACVNTLVRALRPGGLLSISEVRFDPDFQSQQDVQMLMESVGLQHENTFGTPRNYTANFRKPGND